MSIRFELKKVDAAKKVIAAIDKFNIDNQNINPTISDISRQTNIDSNFIYRHLDWLFLDSQNNENYCSKNEIIYLSREGIKSIFGFFPDSTLKQLLNKYKIGFIKVNRKKTGKRMSRVKYYDLKQIIQKIKIFKIIYELRKIPGEYNSNIVRSRPQDLTIHEYLTYCALIVLRYKNKKWPTHKEILNYLEKTNNAQKSFFPIQQLAKKRFIAINRIRKNKNDYQILPR